MGLDLLVVADDLSGAHDCAARLAALHSPVPTARDAKALAQRGRSRAVVLDAETRFLERGAARRRTAQAWTQLSQVASAPWRFQKLDSTLRGNPGEEVEGLVLATAAPWVAVLPAYPRAGRQTLDGIHRVHGVALSRTEYARDPLTPARAGRPQDLFERALSLHVPLAWVGAGARRLAVSMRRAFRRRPPHFVTFDCASDAHVDAIARACVALGCRHFAGASALAGSLAGLLGAGEAEPALPALGLPWVILAGSVSATSLEQVGVARAHGLAAFSTVDTREAIGSKRQGEAALRRLVRDALAKVASVSQRAWFLTGGHTALRFFEAAGLERFDAHGEALPGVALGYAWGAHGGAWVASKPGGFGPGDLYPRFLERVRAR